MNTENTLISELKSLSEKIRQYKSGEGVPQKPLQDFRNRCQLDADGRFFINNANPDFEAAYKKALDQALNIMQKFAGLIEFAELPKNKSKPKIGLRCLEEWCYTNIKRATDEHFKNPAEAGQKIEPGKEPPEKATKGKMLTQRKAETKTELELISDYREQFNKWGQETTVVEANKTFGQMQTALSELNDILQYPQHETSEETLTQARLLRDEIADCVRGTEQYLDRLQPLQKMVLYFADSGYNIATKIARGRAEKELTLEVTTLKRKCESLRSFVSFRCSDFRCLQRELALNWNHRVLQLRVDLTGFDKVFLELRDEQYDRYGDFIKSLEKKYKAITDYFDKVEHKPRPVRREPAGTRLANGGKAGDDVKVTSETAKRKVETVRDQVFICYSHKDKRWLNDLQIHLKPYVRNGSVTAWSDQQISPGSKWLPEIEAALACTRVAVMLVTPNFLASDFIHGNELMPLLKEAEKGKVTIIWVPVVACAYKETSLEDYQAACDPNKPLANMKAERNKAWVKICEEIKKAVSR